LSNTGQQGGHPRDRGRIPQGPCRDSTKKKIESNKQKKKDERRKKSEIEVIHMKVRERRRGGNNSYFLRVGKEGMQVLNRKTQGSRTKRMQNRQMCKKEA